jgi:urocanate hydratase
MADNHIDFKYSSYVQDIMGPMCFDYGLVLSVGFVLQENRRIYKTDTIACQVLEEMAKTAPIEIQQQMQDNIQWIKGAQENSGWFTSENSLCRCRRPCENRFRF